MFFPLLIYRKPNENHYRKNKEGLDLADAELRLHLGVTAVADKNWFYLLSMDGQLWTDEVLISFCLLSNFFMFYNRITM